MKRRLILSIAVCLPTMAADQCPWLNAATAAGVLGGAVRQAVTPASCEFVRQEGGSHLTLRIEVEAARASHAECGTGATPLKAIGNEAQACSYAGAEGQPAEQVVGRVRDQVFLVRIRANDPSVPAKTLREKAVQIARQVAGSLF
jgi:hypothetical protein